MTTLQTSRCFYFLIILLFLVDVSKAQNQAVNVAELTIKIPGLSEEELFYGFAEGDEIIFSFEDVKGKLLKEVEITELPGHSRFMDYKTSKIEKKTLSVTEQGVYSFRFYNAAISGRICKINIQRIPQSPDLANFNTGWEWKTLYDTTYSPYTEDSLIGYEVIQTPYTKKEYVRSDTEYVEIMSPETNQFQIHSRTNLTACFGKSESCTKYMELLTYPQNTEKLLVFVGIGQKSRARFNLLKKSIGRIVIKGTGAALSGGTSLLISGFTNQVTDQDLNNLPSSQNELDILFANEQNASFWYKDYSNRINTYEGLNFTNQVKFFRKFDKKQIPSEKMYICLKNNSASVHADVNLGVVAVCLTKVFEDKEYIRKEKKPIYQKLKKQRMNVKTTKVRVNK